MEDTKEHMTTKEENLFKKFYTEFWPKWRGMLYSQLYRTYHPSTYVESFNSPSSNFEDALEIIEKAVHEGKKLGLLPELDFHYPVLAGKLRILQRDQYVLDWIHSFLLFDVMWDIVHEFRCYCGENGIDPNCEGKCMDEFPPVLEVDSQVLTSGTLKQDYYTLHHYVKDIKERAKGEGLNLDNILPEITNELQYLVPDVTVEDVKIKIKKEMPEIWNLINEQTLKQKNRLDPKHVRSKLRQSTLKVVVENSILIKEHKKYNQPVVEGDIIELIHMEDPYNPIPVMTRGAVMGFEPVPGPGEKIIVQWFMGNDVLQRMPILTDVDAYRKVEINKEEGTNLYEQQEINYNNVSLKTYGNNTFVYFNGVDAKKEGDTEMIILSGPAGVATLESTEVTNKTSNWGEDSIQVNYNRDTQQELDKLFVRKECEFSDKELDRTPNGWGSKWDKGTAGTYKNKLFGTIQDTLKDVYSANVAGEGEPTPLHLPNGIINVPGTDAAGTTVGWSILNFFNTHPLVRKILIDEYENYVNDNNLPCRFLIDEFTDWIKDNKYEIFGGGELFNKMVKTNQNTWVNGQKNETASMAHLKDFYGDGWTLLSVSEPGITEDATGGVDMSMVNTTTNDTHTFQAKPLNYNNGLVDMGDGRWKVNSGWLHWYDPKKVDYYIFTNASTNESYIFKNEGQRPESGGNSIIFNYPPL